MPVSEESYPRKA